MIARVPIPIAKRICDLLIIKKSDFSLKALLGTMESDMKNIA